MEEQLKKLMALLGVSDQGQALELALSRLEGFAEAGEEALQTVTALLAAEIPLEQAVELSLAGRAYRSQLAEDLRRFGALALCEDGEKLPEDFFAALVDGPTAQLEQTVRVYKARAEKKLPLTCQDCGSKNVQGRSSVAAKAQEEASEKKRLVDTSKLHRK